MPIKFDTGGSSFCSKMLISHLHRRIGRLFADLPSTFEIDRFLLLRNDASDILGSTTRNLVIGFVILVFTVRYQRRAGHLGETQARLAHIPRLDSD